MQCPQCEHDNRPQAKFCEECASPLKPVCRNCGSELRATAKFCDECGQSVSEAKPQRPAPEPRSYTPKHLAEKILTSRSALEGERKQVTVLFADVKGSMELAEQVDPEEWHRIMDRFFAILSEGVHRFEGTVNQYTGDGIMALFGAPIAHEDHARRACYAALHLMDELRRYADELRLNQGLNFAVRMGLNSGEVVVGKIGDDLRMDYTAQGHTVGLAARMEQIAEPSRVYVTQETAQLVEGFFRLRDLGLLAVKGVQERLRVYELQGVGALRTRLDVSRARGFSKFVGRTDEMASLEAALERAIQGNGQVIGVVGEAGVGKSRLCYEFTERCRARGLTVTEAHGVAHGKTVPFLGVLEYLRNYFGTTDQDTEQSAREKIAGKLLLLDPELGEALPLLFDFLGVPDPERPVPRMDPEARQRQLFAAMKRITHAQGRREPTLAVIEDLHWIDAGSEAFLGNFVEALAGTRHLLVVNFRPEYHVGWMQKSYYQQMPLVPLSPQAITELLRDLLGSDPSLAGLADRIRERTGGNPFFIEEIVQELVETGGLQGTKGAYRLVTPVEAVAIPASVQAVLAARMDRLAEREKQVLQTASVIGRNFSEPVLRGVAEVSDTDLAASLSSLQRAEFIYEEALYPEAVYAFKHALTQEVAYLSQLTDRRGRVHAAVARTIAELYPDRLDERAALIAHHWEEAGEALEAARWHRRAAEWAGFADPAEASRHWRHALALLEGVAESPEQHGLGVRARIWLLRLGWRVGMPEEEAARLFAEGKVLAESAADMPSLARVISAYGQTQLMAGAVRESLEYALEATRISEVTGHTHLRTNLLPDLAYVLVELGRYAEALRVAEEGLELTRASLRPGGNQRAVVNHMMMLVFAGLAQMEIGSLGEADRSILRAVELARERGELEPLHYALGSRVFLAGYSGRLQGSSAVARECMEIADKVGATYLLCTGLHNLGVNHLWHREWKQASDSLEQQLTIARQIGSGLQWEAAALARLAEAYLGLGNLSQARATVDEAVAVARRRSAAPQECLAYLARARVLLGTEGGGASDDIQSALGEAQRLVEETGGRSQEPFIHEELAELARLNGDETTHQRELREAHRFFTEMGATGHAERLAKELKGAQAPKRKSAAQKPKAKGKAKAVKTGSRAKPKPVRPPARRKSKK